jgi:hypothetical protein
MRSLICADLSDEDPGYQPPYPWGDRKHMCFLVLEDCIKVLWPGDGEFTGWKESEVAPEAQPTRKRSAAPVVETNVGTEQPPPTKKTRAPQRCRKCPGNPLAKGHKCPFRKQKQQKVDESEEDE